jgi:hypothetical protein
MTTLTFDCSPTMTDHDVLRFCQDGYLMLGGVVPQETNDRVMEYCHEHAGDVPLEEEWFRQNVTLNPALTGVVRSLLGKNFSYFSFSASHRNTGPNVAQNWHRDGGSIYSPKIDCLQVFYLPQLTTLEMGPTEVLPGSHLLFQSTQYMSHYGEIRGGVPAEAPAGSIFVTAYGIWHRRMKSTAPGVRNLIKYWYVRTAEPERDWVLDPDFELLDTMRSTDAHKFGREMHRSRNDAAALFYWLAGQHDVFVQEVLGGNLPSYLGPRQQGTIVAATTAPRS